MVVDAPPRAPARMSLHWKESSTASLITESPTIIQKVRRPTGVEKKNPKATASPNTKK